MTDIALLWNADAFGADLGLASGQLATDDGLRTAIVISLFSDARAAPDDPLPEPGADRRGWWGDALTAPAFEIGSKLWLLAREKQLPSVLARAEAYARAALKWLIDDQVASAVTVVASIPRAATLGLTITIDRPNGPARERYDFAWEATARGLIA